MRIEKPAVRKILKIWFLHPDVVVIQDKYLDAITCLGHFRRRDVIPGDAAIIRADDLGLGHAPAIQFVEELNLTQARETSINGALISAGEGVSGYGVGVKFCGL